MSTQDNTVSVSTEDMNMSTKDMSVSPKDIFENTNVYSWSVVSKRKYGDDGEWWLPSQWRAPTRARWSSSAATSRRRRGGWSSDTDPERAESLNIEKDKHRLLWRDIKLTCDGPDYYGVGGDHPEDPLDGHGGGAEHRAEGHTLGGGGGVVHHGVQPGEDLNKVVNKEYGQLQHIAEEEAHHDLPGDNVNLVHGGGEQVPAAKRKRRYFRKLRGGEIRNGVKQTSIASFTVPKIVGGSSAIGTKTETGTGQVLGESLPGEPVSRL